MRKLDYDEFDTREILIGAGVILTSKEMNDTDPVIQKRIDALKVWRKKKASEMALSAFLILSNRTLMAIAKENPETAEALAQIPGIGPKKIANYGDEIMKCISG